MDKNVIEVQIVSRKFGTHICLIDKESYNIYVNGASLWLYQGNTKLYVGYYDKLDGKSKPLHRKIMGEPKGLAVDHIDGNGLNNCATNLRVCTNRQNSMNQKLSIANTTGFKGVRLIKGKGLYAAVIGVNGKDIVIGRYKSIYKAALKYNEMAIKYHGEFAKINELTPAQIEEADKRFDRRININNTTGYRGVCVSKYKNNIYFVATIFDRGKKKNEYLGQFKTAKEAAMAYNSAAIRIKGENAELNKIQ